MKQITVISGKGGTGKTSLTGSLAALSKDAVFADCDVDASNLHLLLQPKILETIEFKGLSLANISEEKCVNCGLCAEKCRFEAIEDGTHFRVNPLRCEGCGVCVRVCPTGAVSFNDRVCGHAYVSDTRFGPLIHAQLIPGMENSGKLVTLVRQTAQQVAEKHGKNLVLIDGPPGIGCPVIASLSGVEASVVVVEPTLSGIHDLERALQLLEHFKIKPLVCINKYDINLNNSSSIEDFCRKREIRIMGNIPFDDTVTKAMVKGQTVIEYAKSSPFGIAIKKIWINIMKEENIP